MSRGSDSELVRVGKLSEHICIPVHTLRRLADAGKIPAVRTKGGHRLFDPTAVRAALSALERSDTYGAARIVPDKVPTWSGTFALTDGIEEHLVWQQINNVLCLDEGSPAGGALRYAITEMFNNAIDHSHGTSATVAVWASPDDLTFRISDDGQGAFAHLRRGLGLADDFESISALSKGKQTTWKERHTGEGIFFTSKVMDVFQLSSNGIRWTVDNTRGDHAVGVSDVEVGTVVVGQVDPQTTRSTREVFGAYSQDYEFVRTRPAVKLFGLGLRFVSRSEARRLLTNLDEFTEIDVDFAGVEDVGQGFVDELLRVWPHEHPGKTINPINMNEAVEFMIKRGLSR